MHSNINPAQMKPNKDFSGLTFSSFAFMLRWPDTHSLTLGTPVSSYSVSRDPEVSYGGYKSIIYNGSSSEEPLFTNGTEYILATIDIQSNSSGVKIELAPYSYATQLNGAWYVEIGVAYESTSDIGEYYANLTAPLAINAIQASAEIVENKALIRFQIPSTDLNEICIEQKQINGFYKEVQKVAFRSDGQYRTTLTIMPGLNTLRVAYKDASGKTYYSADLEVRKEIPGGFYVEQLFPNPLHTTGTLHFVAAKSQKLDISLYNVAGQKIQYFDNLFVDADKPNALEIDMRPFSAGTYFIILEGESIARQTVKFVKN